MKNIFCIVILSLLLNTKFYGQTIDVSGSVYSTSGFAIRGAKVKSIVDKKTVITDSSGNFTIALHIPDNLLISYPGFITQKINIADANKTSQSIKLVVDSFTSGTSNDEMNKQGIQNSIDERSSSSNSFVYSGGSFSRGIMFPSFVHKEDTKGSRYLLDDWAKGVVKGKDNSIISNNGFVYNYDKTSGSLIMTNDMRTAVTIDNSQISQFTLLSKSSDSMVFEIQPQIDKDLFIQLLAGGGKYKLFKKTKTNFVKANYRTTGLTSSGNVYDEYVDRELYYLMNVKDNMIKEIALKQKSIKSALPSESEKMNSFFDQHKAAKVDEKYLIDLINFLNQ